MPLKILQWNIWIQENPENIATLINELKPDIACLQELNPNSAKLISEKTNANFYYHAAQTWHDREQGNGIFSKLPISNRNFRYLQDPHTGSTNHDSQGRVYIEVEVEDLTIGTTHLSYEPYFVDSEVKLHEAQNLENIIKIKSSRYIVTGDFNSSPGSKVLTMISALLKNLGPDLSEKTWTTKPFAWEDFKEDKLNWRLDHAFGTNDIKRLRSEIIQTNFSDHLPLLLEIDV